MPSSRIRLASGRMYDPFNPSPEDFEIGDIATGLSCMPRFGGHQPRIFGVYSVAEHSIRASELAPNPYKLQALLHDAPEALGLMDLPGPIKHHHSMKPYCLLSDLSEMVICKKWGLDYPLKNLEVAKVDKFLGRIEQRDIQGVQIELDEPYKLGPKALTRDEAELKFLEAFRYLYYGVTCG